MARSFVPAARAPIAPSRDKAQPSSATAGKRSARRAAVGGLSLFITTEERAARTSVRACRTTPPTGGARPPTALSRLTMALWNAATWNSGALWSAPSPSPSTNPNKRHHTMKRQRYFPATVAARPEWFNNYATQLPLANPVLALPAADVTASVADARYCEHVCGAWLTAARELGPAATAAVDDLFDGAGADPFVLPGFNPPPLPAGVTAVPPGALRRIFAFVQTIKASPGYTEAIGLQLGIVGQEDAAEHPLPEFSVKVERGGTAGSCECVKVVFKKFGRQGVVIYSRRGGGAWEMLAIDLSSPYLDERPLLAPGTPEVREYRLQYYDDAAPVGGFTDVVSVTVTP